MNKDLIILRSVPGAGKSTFARMLVETFVSPIIHFEADMWHLDENGEYKYNPNNIEQCHANCKLATEQAMKDGINTIVVSNTFTREWEMQPYFDLAKSYEYRVTSLIVENRANTKSIHNVPEETIEKMRKRLKENIKL